MAAEGAWLDLAPRKHRDRHGPMGPDDSSATAASKVVPVAVGREGSKRSVVAVAGVMVVQRRRWIGMELKMEAGMKAVAHERTTMSG